MFTYIIATHITNHTLRIGLIECAKKLSSANPDWEYRIVNEGDAHLIVLDFTSREILSEQDLQHLVERPDSRTLVLLGARQKGMAQYLYQTYCCSLLCVDERTFRIRELVECTIKKIRYISPLFRSMFVIESQHKIDAEFTDAEARVINLLSSGNSGLDISRKLFRSQKTISTHKRNIMRKLGVKNSFELHKVISEMFKYYS